MSRPGLSWSARDPFHPRAEPASIWHARCCQFPLMTETAATSDREPWFFRRAQRVDARWLKFRRRVKRRLGVLDPLRLDAYRGYAGPSSAILRGRALEDELPRPPLPEDSVWDNLRRSWRQLESDEVPALALEVQLAAQTVSVVTDKDGYFAATLDLMEPLPEGLHPFRVRVIDEDMELARGVTAEGTVFVPPRHAAFGVISDIDDTILQSHATHRLRQAYVTLLGNAVTRLSYPGTQQLYRGLERAGAPAPFFYVSRSAWNIHAVLEHFITHQGLPEGPLVLRHVGLLDPPERRRGHKRREIERIFAMFPELSFVLIGDSGQRDAAVYADVARRHPERVRAILIRDVSSAHRREERDQALTREVPPSIPWTIFEHADDASQFCEAHGLWAPEALPQPPTERPVRP